nr:MAG: CPBP family intramembrane metalloprotease [Pseudomonadota bacterium]
MLKRLTIDQWRAIDARYKSESLPDLRAAAVLLTAGLSLVLPHYFGRPRMIDELPGLKDVALAVVPYPDLLPHLYWAAFKLVNYGILPYLCIRLVLRARGRDHGLRFVREPRVWVLYAAMVALVVPLAYVASGSEAFLRTYPKYANAGASLEQFLLWELAYGFQFLMLEFFFRGFFVFALARYIGSLAIFVMVVPYAMIHFGKPLAECLGSIVAGVALGTIALRTGSIYGGVAVHCAVAWSMDLFALAGHGKLTALFGG